MGINFTRIALAFGLASTMAFAEKYEAETATLSGDAEVSGTYVKMNEGNITFNVSVASAGNYDITIHYKNNYGGSKINNLEANGMSSAVTFEVTPAGTFADVKSTMKLNAGAQTVAITHSWGWIDVDYISIDPHEATKFNISSKLVNANATPEAVKLYSFLVENFGKKTISGVMTGNMDAYTMGAGATSHEDVQAVFKASGKNPVLVGIDLMNATGKNASESWFKEYTNKGIDIAKSIWQSGGIPAITWHWRPGNEVEFYTPKGNPSQNTEFDFTKAFTAGTTNWNTASEEYQALVGDIDKIATLLLDLQQANVAAIFRPLHESGGNWFWWSAHSGNQFAALYRLVYDRLVKEKGVNNLVWVFNPQDASYISWTPGDEYYDIISVDIYNKADDHQSNASAFIGYTEKTEGKKIVALSENGPIPDVAKSYEDGAPWSWWMPWYESPSWNGGYVSQTSASVWKTNMADERIITLDEMPGWDKYTPSVNNGGTAIITNKLTQSKMMVQGSSLMLSTSALKNASIDVFSMTGKHMATLHRGAISAGTHAFSMQSLARGNYIVQVKGSGMTATNPVTIK